MSTAYARRLAARNVRWQRFPSWRATKTARYEARETEWQARYAGTQVERWGVPFHVMALECLRDDTQARAWYRASLRRRPRGARTGPKAVPATRHMHTAYSRKRGRR
jgi:hypothetical protein